MAEAACDTFFRDYFYLHKKMIIKKLEKGKGNVLENGKERIEK